jgi:hypothetical protein
MKNIIALIFMLLNLCWSAIALFVDLEVIGNIPFYLWPFTIICPLFPFLLFWLWLKIYSRKKIGGLCLSLFSLPPIAYFFGSLIYYPYWMTQNGFNIYAFGQIFWVAFYGIQGFWFIFKYKNEIKNDILAMSYIVISFMIQYSGRTFGYLDITNIDDQVMANMYILVVITTVLIVITKRVFSTPSPLFLKR